MSQKIKVGFWNVCGLSGHKWLASVNAIESKEVDLLFLAETWFVDQKLHIRHKYYIASSAPVYQKKINSHQPSGIMCLVSDELRQSITSTSFSKYSVSVRFSSFSIAAVYFPPSMDVPTITSYMPTQPVDILLGDINTKFGVKFGTKQVGPSAKVNYFNDYTSENGLLHLIPTPPESTPDHAFVKIGINATWNFCSRLSSGLSDHCFMVLSFSSSTRPIVPMDSDSVKFNLKPLEYNSIQRMLIAEYVANRYLVAPSLKLLNSTPPKINSNAKQNIVDACYSIYSSFLYAVCDSVLGTYSVQGNNSKQTNPSKRQTSNSKSTNIATNAIQTFKEAQKTNIGTSSIQSRSSSTPVVDDVVDYFKGVFAPPPPNTSVFDSTLYQYPSIDTISSTISFCSSNIKKNILKYPSTKSSGTDPFHINIYKTLAKSSYFLDDLSDLFHCFVRLAITPSDWNTSHIFPIPKSKDNGSLKPVYSSTWNQHLWLYSTQLRLAFEKDTRHPPT
ncbi:hypothetical protein BB560_003416 [Smittium megazygosporum]|uniref:Endonuclease/exonuclease/phosphatase domain-containing protein n=1 Tax=Smittium megazygosporum TaxID=133381 RepID=A0A2T9ZC66_9FUNG|nr:hypothetical protein BB560_003416 [Smittium megazygosporum]